MTSEITETSDADNTLNDLLLTNVPSEEDIQDVSNIKNTSIEIIPEDKLKKFIK